MSRRNFFKSIAGIVGGLYLGSKVMASPDELRVGQIWWDKDCAWTDRWQEAKVICLLLSADTEPLWGGKKALFWSAAQFYWCVDGYLGAPIRKFTEDEVRKMYLVGNISEIKSFRE